MFMEQKLRNRSPCVRVYSEGNHISTFKCFLINSTETIFDFLSSK